MNFTFEVKQEIINKKMNKNEIHTFISGVFFANWKKDVDKIKVKILNEKILNRLIKFLNNIKLEYENKNKSILINKELIQNIFSKNATLFLAGLFVSSGSVSNLDSSSYHLQISFKDEAKCDEILEFAKKHIHFSKTRNRNNYVLYLKKNESISDFLQIIGAQNSYFNFIDSVIKRDLENQINRIYNLDVHNQSRLVNSNESFLNNLQFIKKNNLEHLFSDEQLEFYEFKKNNQFLPLSQLSEELEKNKGIKKSKGGLNHWLIKLKNICKDNKN